MVSERETPAVRSSRESGAMLLELVIAMTVLAIGVLALISSFQGTFAARRDVMTRDSLSTLFNNAVDTLENDTFSTLYSTYNGTTITPLTGTVTSDPKKVAVGELLDADGNPAEVAVDFFVDETNMPAEFGPILDIDGDGAMSTADCSSTYILLPTRLRITYQGRNGVETEDMFLVLMD